MNRVNRSKIIQSFLWIVFAFCLTLLDISFLSLLDVSGASLLSSFVVILSLALSGMMPEVAIMSLALVLFMTDLSSLPMWYLVAFYYVLPNLMVYVRLRLLPDLATITSLLFFVVFTVLLELTALVVGGEITGSAINTAGYFVLINTIAGTACYGFIKRIRENLRYGEIKL